MKNQYSGTSDRNVPSVRAYGKCQIAHNAPRIRLDTSSEYLSSNPGRAKPRQPISSPSPSKPNVKTKNNMMSFCHNGVSAGPNGKPAAEKSGEVPPVHQFMLIASRVTNADINRAIKYHCIPTRHLMSLPKRSRRPCGPYASDAARIERLGQPVGPCE